MNSDFPLENIQGNSIIYQRYQHSKPIDLRATLCLRQCFHRSDKIQATQPIFQQNNDESSSISFKKEESDLKKEFTPKFETSEAGSIIHIKEEMIKNEQDLSLQSNFLSPILNQNGALIIELRQMIGFILFQMGKNSTIQIETGRNIYLKNPPLLQIYDKLVLKYYSARKCKEDIVRYILRKAFRIIRLSIMKTNKVSSKNASLLLCKRYFQDDLERMKKAGVDINNEDELFEFFLPYQKKSQNRTMNTNFVFTVFSSDDFCREYEKFLGEFDIILIEDNDKRKEKLVKTLVECVETNSLEKLGTISRLPWLEVWIQDTKSLAISLLSEQKVNKKSKKLKKLKY